MRAPFLWFGGKAALASRIAALLPPHRRYYELFGGGCAVFFASQADASRLAPRASRLAPRATLLNDLNPLAVNLLRVIRDDHRALLAALPQQVDREAWREAQANVWAALPPASLRTQQQRDAVCGRTPQSGVALAASTYIACNAGMNARLYGARTSDTAYSAKMASALSRRLALLPAAAALLRETALHNRDALDLLTEYADDDEGCFFLDPPYMLPAAGGGSRRHADTYGYGDSESAEWHTLLLERCAAVRGSIVLTSGDDDIYRSHCASMGWTLALRREKVRRGNDKARWNAAHLVWLNAAAAARQGRLL